MPFAEDRGDLTEIEVVKEPVGSKDDATDIEIEEIPLHDQCLEISAELLKRT